ncbi:MAG: single-stranded DNA-binding protein [Verrucomicrobiota bacterium]
MVSTNRVFLAGYLAGDPVIRRVSTGTAVANVRLAVNEYFKTHEGVADKSTCFVDVVVWDKQAEACADYLAKGSPVLVEGRLQYERWESPDGETRSRLRVKADRVQFLSARNRSAVPSSG